MSEKSLFSAEPFIVGWERILPELAAFFTVLKLREDGDTEDFLPVNIFLAGKIGTNKTKGLYRLAQCVGLSSDHVDCSTIEDVAELVGMVNLYALREKGELEIAQSEFLGNDLPILDEFLASRPHVLPQFKLLLQRKFKLQGKRIPITLRGLAATANLSEDMDAGEANVLDSPTADRFAMLIRVPEARDLETGERDAIIECRGGNGFEETFVREVERAVRRIQESAFLEQYAPAITRYVRVVQDHLMGTPLQFQMRRAQVLRQLLIAACAGMEGENALDLERIYKVMSACLSVPLLTGQELDMGKLGDAHRDAQMYLILDERARSIYDAGTLEEKMKWMLQERMHVDVTVQLDVLKDVMDRGSVEMKLALLELLNNSSVFDGNASLKDFGQTLEKHFLEDFGEPVLPEESQELIKKHDGFYSKDIALLRCAQGDPRKYREIMKNVKKYVDAWRGAAE